LDFDFNEVRTTEFGVGYDEGDGREFVCITVDVGVQSALREMAVATWDSMQKIESDPAPYEPSEKYASLEHIALPISDDLARQLRELHEAQNLPIDNTALSDPSKVFCYFARMTDSQGRRLTAVRRATQFKGVLKNRLIRLVTDALKIIEDNVFKLDNDFDLLIDSSYVHILRPSGFEFVGKLQSAILAAVPQNIQEIGAELTFVDFNNIQEYASKHTRAARYLASIRAQGEMRNIDRRALKRLCKNTGVAVRTINGKLTVEDKDIMGFLEVLDRRRYEVELVKDSPERFKAASRRKLNN